MAVFTAKPHGVYPLDFLPVLIGFFLGVRQHCHMTMIRNNCIDNDNDIFPFGADAHNLDHGVVVIIISE